MKDHNLFKPRSLEEGKHAVVGDCNGFSMQQRWDAETPAFARAILGAHGRPEKLIRILDYGCGVGRLSKEILNQHDQAKVVGVDASAQMMQKAEDYVGSARFSTSRPEHLSGKFDVAYLVYVLQHVPAIEIREILMRIHSHLKDNGTFVYCSSDYRMAIRYDGQGFFDDRFLGVDLQAEVDRFFVKMSPLFSKEDFAKNEILSKMVEGSGGGLPHPAFIYKKREIGGQIFNAGKEVAENGKTEERSEEDQENQKGHVLSPCSPGGSSPVKLLLVNRLAPGDILVMSNAIRDLHKAHPGKFLTAVRTPCNDIFLNNPYVVDFEYDQEEFIKVNASFQATDMNKMVKEERAIKIGDVLAIDMHYPLIHSSGKLGSHFGEGHRAWLEWILDIKIPQTDLRPEIFLDDNERNWPSPALVKGGITGRYWVINAGSKSDFQLKQYPKYQEVVDLFRDRITFIQIGQKAHNHVPLTGPNVVDLVGKTGLRDLFRLISKADGVLTCVSLPMHIAAAFNRPCVVVAGAREGTRWELYPNQQFMYVNGCLPCATYDGCWKSKIAECNNKKSGTPMCMDMIRPEDVARSIERYYEGGMIDAYELSCVLGEVAHV